MCKILISRAAIESCENGDDHIKSGALPSFLDRIDGFELLRTTTRLTLELLSGPTRCHIAFFTLLLGQIDIACVRCDSIESHRLQVFNLLKLLLDNSTRVLICASAGIGVLLDIPDHHAGVLAKQIDDLEEFFFKSCFIVIQFSMWQSCIIVHYLHVWDLGLLIQSAWFTAHFVFFFSIIFL